MRPIPPKLRAEMDKDPFMHRCIYEDIGKGEECDGRVEWEHAFTYRVQINEAWAIVPVCTYHHRGKGLDKAYNQFRAIIRANVDDLVARMPKTNWRQIDSYLRGKYSSTLKEEMTDVIKPPIL